MVCWHSHSIKDLDKIQMSNKVQVKLLEFMNSLNNKVILIMNMYNINFLNFNKYLIYK